MRVVWGAFRGTVCLRHHSEYEEKDRIFLLRIMETRNGDIEAGNWICQSEMESVWSLSPGRAIVFVVGPHCPS